MAVRIALIVLFVLAAWSAWYIASAVSCYPDSAGNCYLTKF
jgi:hypothetical protein